MTLDIEKIKAAALAATQGIWAFGSFHRLLVVPVSDDGHPDKNSPIADLGETEIPWDATEDSKTRYNNAIHIATANPQAVLELITRLEAAEKDATRYQLLKSIATAQADSNGPIYRIDIRRTCEYLGFNVSVDGLEEMKGGAA